MTFKILTGDTLKVISHLNVHCDDDPYLTDLLCSIVSSTSPVILSRHDNADGD